MAEDIPRRRRALLLLAALPLAGAAPASAAGTAFDRAVASYRAGRYSEAFGRLLALADRGDPDAARIVMFMHRYGPMLYGSYWDVSQEEIEGFEEAAAGGKGRRPPPFQRPVAGGRRR